jgi:hypothetical protein
MRRIVIDTNLYIEWLNAGRHEAVLFQRDAVKYLSAVVMLELYAGAFSPRDRRIVRRVGDRLRSGRAHFGSRECDLRGGGACAASAPGIARVPGGGLALAGQ